MGSYLNENGESLDKGSPHVEQPKFAGGKRSWNSFSWGREEKKVEHGTSFSGLRAPGEKRRSRRGGGHAN